MLGIMLAMSVLSVSVCLYMCLKISRQRKRCDSMPVEKAGENLPGVSVILYSQDEALALETLLPSILNQDYDGAMEVIVVNEGESSDVRNLIGPMQLQYRNLYLTHTPDGAHNLSRKKLAITLGVKAARFPVVILTTADVVIQSDKWLYSIMRRFEDERVEVVLGYAAPYIDEFSKAPSAVREIDYAISSMTWIDAALAGNPYRGTEYNVAYRKELFFTNKGFCRSLNLHFGDDDIFINEITNGSNTAVELSTESIVGFRSVNFNKLLRQNSLRRNFTEQFVRDKHDRLPWVMTLSLWLWLVTGVVSILFCPLNLFVYGLVILSFIVTYILEDWSLTKMMKSLQLNSHAVIAPVAALLWPIRKICQKTLSRIGKQRRYTWE